MKEPEPRTQTDGAERPRRAIGPLQTGRGGERGRGKDTKTQTAAANTGARRVHGGGGRAGGVCVPGAVSAATTPSGYLVGRWASVELPGESTGARYAAIPAPHPNEPRAAGTAVRRCTWGPLDANPTHDFASIHPQGVLTRHNTDFLARNSKLSKLSSLGVAFTA
jgi:hypothetical protein